VIKLGDLSPKRDFTFVEDTADAFLAMGLADGLEFGTAYNGGTGRTVTIGETADLIRKICGTEKPIETEDVRMRPKKSEVRALMADNTRISETVGWKPRHSLENGLAKTVAWWRERLDAGRLRSEASYVL